MMGMCKLYVLNQLVLGGRELGWECFNGKEIVEMTSKQIKDGLKAGKEIYGLRVTEKGEFVPDEKVFYNNYMIKSHIGNLRPYGENAIANVMYVVTGSHTDNGVKVYNVISSRFEQACFTEERLKALMELGLVQGGAKLEDGKIVLPFEETAEPEAIKAEGIQTEEVKAEMKPIEVKEDKKAGEVKQAEKKK